MINKHVKFKAYIAAALVYHSHDIAICFNLWLSFHVLIEKSISVDGLLLYDIVKLSV